MLLKVGLKPTECKLLFGTMGLGGSPLKLTEVHLWWPVHPWDYLERSSRYLVPNKKKIGTIFAVGIRGVGQKQIYCSLSFALRSPTSCKTLALDTVK